MTGKGWQMSGSGVSLGLGLAIDIGDLGVGTSTHDLFEFVAAAESAGVQSIWLGENYSIGEPGFHVADPLLVLAVLAGRTSMRLGTGVLLLNAWTPARLAYEGALLDRISDGRLTLGLAAGSAEVAARLTGTTPLEGPGIERFLRALRAAWSGAEAVVPLPHRAGGPELLLGGRLRRAARRAARLADGWYGSSTYGRALVASQSEAYRASVAEGRTPQVVINRFAVVRADEDEARRVAERHLVPVLERYFAKASVHLESGHEGAGAPVDARTSLDDLAIVGSPTTVRSRLQDYASVGVTSVQVRVRTLGMPWPTARATLDELHSSGILIPDSPSATEAGRRPR